MKEQNRKPKLKIKKAQIRRYKIRFQYIWNEISDFIIKKLHHGVTVTSAVGEYTKEEKSMIHTVCKRFEAIKLRAEIKEIDPHAFIIVTTSSEIIGRGFRSVW